MLRNNPEDRNSKEFWKCLLDQKNGYNLHVTELVRLPYHQQFYSLTVQLQRPSQQQASLA
jgi:hypothetical protein